MDGRRVLADSWYATELGWPTVDDVLPRRLPRALTSNPLIRGVLLWWYGRRREIVACAGSGSVFRVLAFLERVAGRRGRHLVLFEFIPAAEPAGGRGSARLPLRRALRRHVVQPVLQRSLLFAHTLTEWERERNALMFGVPQSRFVYLPWPLVFRDDELPEYGERTTVVASGRSLCDWPTVFEAARGQGWDLVVVCAADDLDEVRRLNHDGTAKVLSEIPLEEHRRLVAEAAVYMLALKEGAMSSGHIRVMDCVRGGTPLVAAAVLGLDQYVRDGETALLYAPGDHLAARRAVNRLLEDGDLRSRLREVAFERAQAWPREDYLAAIGGLLERRPSASPDAALGHQLTR
jgi:hypothetical protein